MSLRSVQFVRSVKFLTVRKGPLTLRTALSGVPAVAYFYNEAHICISSLPFGYCTLFNDKLPFCMAN